MLIYGKRYELSTEDVSRPQSRIKEINMQGDSMLRAVTCQFPVSCDIRTNAKYIKRFIKKAAAINADIVHFSETALSGYAEYDFQSFEGFNWDLLREQTCEIMSLAKKFSIWIIL